MPNLVSELAFSYQEVTDAFRLEAITSATPTEIVLGASSNNGFRVVLGGTGLTTSGNNFTGGTISSITYFSFEGTELWRITNFNTVATDLQTAITPLRTSNNGAAFLSLWQSSPWVSQGGLQTDELIGGTSADILRGGYGEDTFVGYQGADTIDGGFFEATAISGVGGSDFDIVNYRNENGPNGILGDLQYNFIIDSFGSRDTVINVERINGTVFNDGLWGREGASESFAGFQGNDFFDGRGTNDFDRIVYFNEQGPNGVTVNLTTGVAIDSFGFTDTLVSIESVRGTARADTLIGTNLNNVFEGLAGNDTIDGGDGVDEVRYEFDFAFNNTANALGANGIRVNLTDGFARDGYRNTDVLTSIENVRGTPYADRIVGSAADNRLRGFDGGDYLEGRAGSDRLEAGEGDDILSGGLGADFLDGGAGLDYVVYDDSTAAVQVDLQFSNAFGGEAQGDIFAFVEGATASNFNDGVWGTEGANWIYTWWGDDYVEGRGGNDFVDGAGGNDTLYGQDGTDYLRGGDGTDYLDGGIGNDTIEGGNTDDNFVIKASTLASGSVETFTDFSDVSGNTDYIRFEGVRYEQLFWYEQGSSAVVGIVLDGGAGYAYIEIQNFSVARLSDQYYFA